MTRTEAEHAYIIAHRNLIAAKDAERQAEQDIMTARGITLPLIGPMKNKYHHHRARLLQLANETYCQYREEHPYQ